MELYQYSKLKTEEHFACHNQGPRRVMMVTAYFSSVISIARLSEPRQRRGGPFYASQPVLRSLGCDRATFWELNLRRGLRSNSHEGRQSIRMLQRQQHHPPFGFAGVAALHANDNSNQQQQQQQPCEVSSILALNDNGTAIATDGDPPSSVGDIEKPLVQQLLSSAAYPGGDETGAIMSGSNNLRPISSSSSTRRRVIGGLIAGVPIGELAPTSKDLNPAARNSTPFNYFLHASPLFDRSVYLFY